MESQVIISAAPELLDRDWIVGAVLGSYWGGGFTREQVLAALAESEVWGAYRKPDLPQKDGYTLRELLERAAVPYTQIGFFRAITDTAIFSSITDVYVDEAHRGKGIGSALRDAVIRDSRMAKTMCILQARPTAQLWYLKWGFRVVDPVNGIMQRNPS